MTMQLVGYTDADWAGNATDRRSTSGYAFSLGSAAIAGNIFWKCVVRTNSSSKAIFSKCVVRTSTGFSGSGSVESRFRFTKSTMESWNSFLAIPSTSLNDNSTLLSRIRSSRTFRRSVVLSISMLN